MAMLNNQMVTFLLILLETWWFWHSYVCSGWLNHQPDIRYISTSRDFGDHSKAGLNTLFVMLNSKLHEFAADFFRMVTKLWAVTRPQLQPWGLELVINGGVEKVPPFGTLGVVWIDHGDQIPRGYPQGRPPWPTMTQAGKRLSSIGMV